VAAAPRNAPFVLPQIVANPIIEQCVCAILRSPVLIFNSLSSKVPLISYGFSGVHWWLIYAMIEWIGPAGLLQWELRHAGLWVRL